MFTKIKSIKILLVVFLFVFSIFFASKASAIEYGMLGGKPANPDPNVADSSSWFIYKLAPGEKKEDALQVMNLYENELGVLVYAADGTKSSGGGFALKQYTEEKEEVGAWVKFYPENVPTVFQEVFDQKEGKIIDFCNLSKEDLQAAMKKTKLSDEDFDLQQKWCQGTEEVTLSLAAKESRKIPFVFSVADKADVGEHTGGILIQKAQLDDAGADQQGSAVKLTTRVGVRIYETVPGQVIKNLTFSDFKLVKNYKELNFMRWFQKNPKPEDFLVQGDVTNSGNVSVDFQNVISIKDSFFGKRTQEITDRNFQVLKADTFVSNYSWESPRFGKYTFAMGLKYTDDQGNEQSTFSNPITVWIFPWREIIATLVGALILGGIYLGRKKYLKKKYGAVGWVEYSVKKTDTIAKLAKKYEIDWEILVRTNKIKPPFLLEAGMIVLVPPTIVGKEVPTEAVKTASKEKKIVKETKAPVKTKSAAKIVPEAVLVESVRKPFNKKYLIWGAIILLIAGIIVAGVNFAKKNKSAEVNTQLSITSLGGDVNESQSVATVETEKPAEASAPVPTEVKKETGNVVILNGGAVPGSAGKLSDFLKTNGVTEIEAKNAELDTHTGITVYYQEEYSPFAEKIVKTLNEKYENAKLEVATNDEQKSAAVVIVLGK
ncbi:MAG: LytR C-terminal domain-containing protein [Candidatus Moranbacteria bacterium]|nr:LytR C-terminal domain-containing protein [Candidatus Moranbacteria bacterium]